MSLKQQLQPGTTFYTGFKDSEDFIVTTLLEIFKSGDVQSLSFAEWKEHYEEDQSLDYLSNMPLPVGMISRVSQITPLDKPRHTMQIYFGDNVRYNNVCINYHVMMALYNNENITSDQQDWLLNSWLYNLINFLSMDTNYVGWDYNTATITFIQSF